MCWNEELNHKWILSHSSTPQHFSLWLPSCDETFLNEIHFIHINSNQGFWLWPKPPILMKFPFPSFHAFHSIHSCSSSPSSENSLSAALLLSTHGALSFNKIVYIWAQDLAWRRKEKLVPIKVDIAQYFSSPSLPLTLKEISNDTHIPWFGYANENETVESWVMCFNLQNVWINLNYFFLFFFLHRNGDDEWLKSGGAGFSVLILLK